MPNRYDKTGENKAAAVAAAIARKQWREAQDRASKYNVGLNGWIDLCEQKPANGQYVLVCSDPYFEFNPAVQIEMFIVPSKLIVSNEWNGFIAMSKEMEESCKDAEESIEAFDGAFLDLSREYVCTWSEPWFPAFWMPLPLTPYQTGAVAPFKDPTQ